MDNNNKEPLKKYQSIAQHIEDMENRIQFRKDGQVIATWSGGGVLYLSRHALVEEDAIELATWILKMTQEETYSNE